MRGHPGRRPRKEIVHERDRRFVAQFARIALCHDPFRGLVQHDALVGHEKNAWQFVRHNNDRDAQVPAECEDELVELDR